MPRIVCRIAPFHPDAGFSSASLRGPTPAAGRQQMPVEARQPDRGEGHQVVQQAGRPQSLSERVDEGQSGSCLLTRGDETTPERRLQRGGLNEHVRSQERCDRWRLPCRRVA